MIFDDNGNIKFSGTSEQQLKMVIDEFYWGIKSIYNEFKSLEIDQLAQHDLVLVIVALVELKIESAPVLPSGGPGSVVTPRTCTGKGRGLQLGLGDLQCLTSTRLAESALSGRQAIEFSVPGVCPVCVCADARICLCEPRKLSTANSHRNSHKLLANRVIEPPRGAGLIRGGNWRTGMFV